MPRPRTCACCPRPAWAGGTDRARSNFCWHPGCPCFAWCDGCERAKALPGLAVCGPCALRLARDPRRRPARPAPVGTAKTYGGGTIERKGRRYRARVGGGVGGRYRTLGYFATEAEAAAAIAADRREGGRRAA